MGSTQQSTLVAYQRHCLSGRKTLPQRIEVQAELAAFLKERHFTHGRLIDIVIYAWVFGGYFFLEINNTSLSLQGT